MVKPLDRRTLLVTVALTLLVLVQLTKLFSHALVRGLVDPRGLDGQTLMYLAWAEQAAPAILVFLALAFFFWLHRAYDNLRALGAQPRWSAALAVGWWFVPVLNLLRPRQVLEELRLGAPAPDIQHAAPGTQVVLWLWWLCWLVICSYPLAIGLLVFVVARSAEADAGVMAFLSATTAYIVALRLAVITACLCLILYCRRAAAWQEQRRRALGLPLA